MTVVGHYTNIIMNHVVVPRAKIGMGVVRQQAHSIIDVKRAVMMNIPYQQLVPIIIKGNNLVHLLL